MSVTKAREERIALDLDREGPFPDFPLPAVNAGEDEGEDEGAPEGAEATAEARPRRAEREDERLSVAGEMVHLIRQKTPLLSYPRRAYPVPVTEDFEDSIGVRQPFISAIDLGHIGRALIEMYPELELLNMVGWEFLWQQTGSTAGGMKQWGHAKKADDLLRWYAGGIKWTFWLAADAFRLLGASVAQIEAAVWHELLHAGVNKRGKPTNRPHDFEGFTSEVQRYGLWTGGLRRLGIVLPDAPVQLPLPLDGIAAVWPGDAAEAELNPAETDADMSSDAEAAQ